MVIQILHSHQDPGAGANHDAEVPSNFTPIGEAADAVILRLRSKLPRIKVKKVRTAQGEEPSRPR